MSIRQSNNPSESHQHLRIAIRTAHPLIGEAFYAPSISVTNSFDSPITVVAVDLRVCQQAFADKRVRPQELPLHLLPRQTGDISVWFDLHTTVKQMLSGKSGEIQVHFVRNDHQETATALVVGESLKH